MALSYALVQRKPRNDRHIGTCARLFSRGPAPGRTCAERWKELNDFQRRGGYYTKAPLARQAFAAVPLGRYDHLWRDRSYTGRIEPTLEADAGWSVTIELIVATYSEVLINAVAPVELYVLLYRDHYESLKLVREDLPGLALVDGDAHPDIQSSARSRRRMSSSVKPLFGWMDLTALTGNEESISALTYRPHLTSWAVWDRRPTVLFPGW